MDNLKERIKQLEEKVNLEAKQLKHSLISLNVFITNYKSNLKSEADIKTYEEKYSIYDQFYKSLNKSIDKIKNSDSCYHENIFGRFTKTEETTDKVFDLKLEKEKITFNDVIGLDEAKRIVEDNILLSNKYPDIFDLYNQKSEKNLLLYGLSGNGKTTFAKALCNAINARFFEIKCSDIFSKWLGESENNIKNLFSIARKEKQAVIIFDEFDAIASTRTDKNEKINSVINELLTQIDGFENNENIVLIATTNKPWLIDSAMLRPGRFGNMIYIPLPNEKDREQMIKNYLKGIPLSFLDIQEIVEYTEGFSGADIKRFCNELKLEPIKQTIQSGTNKIFPITMQNFNNVKAKIKSSIQQKDIQAIEDFKQINK